MFESTNRRRDALALAFAFAFPTVLTLAYFYWLSHTAASTQQSVFGIGKLIQFGFPLAWTATFYRHRIRDFFKRSETSDSKRWLLIAVGFGIFVIAAMLGMYFLVLNGSAAGETLTANATAKISDLGVSHWSQYAAVGLFYCVCHSLLEEYYWRWFVYDGLKNYMPTMAANVLSGVGFMAHHVVLLSVYFGLTSPLTWLCSASIALGGIVWAWMYESSGRLRWPWISHAIVDAGIFTLGYFLVRSVW